MSDVIVSKAGIHCVGDKRNGYGAFLQTIHAAGRRLSLVKCRDNFGAIDEPLALWPETITIGAMTVWDDADYNVDTAYNRIVQAAALNPKVKYWEYFNERNGDWPQQADLYMALMPRLAQAGIGLCMFNCASGTPQYPYIDPIPYSEIARACRAALLSSYDVILGVHEYQSEGGTIGRFATLANYLEARSALLPIAVTEYGFETHPGDAAFMAMIRANDPIYMSDSRVIGCATWTLGGGGWGDSNFQTALPQLGEYIAAVAAVSPPPAAEWDFDFWEVDGARRIGNPLELLMDGDHVITPHAKKKIPPPIALYELTINLCPEFAGLQVTVTPPGLVYAAGTQVTCEALL